MTASFTPLGRSAAELISLNKRFPSSCAPLDKLLGGGLPAGHVMELSGPPGTAKQTLAIKFASLAVSSNDQVLFVDMQNMASPASLYSELRSKHLADASLDFVHYLNIFTLPDLLIFLHNLPMFLETHTSIRLIILNSIWFPFQTSPGLTMSRRAILLTHVKQALARICSSLDVAIVITTQLSTKFLNPDGTPASYDSGSRAILVPQLGSDYLPPYRTYRVLIVPETRTSGFEFLLFFLHGKSKEVYISSGFYACFCPPVVMVRASPSKSLTKWTAIRWALATFNAIYAIYIDFPSTGVLGTPNVSTPVRVLEFGFERTELPGRKASRPR